VNSPRLLVVDDDPMALRLMQRMLQGQPWGLDLAAHASEAMALAEIRRPDIILIDICLPQIGGAELARRLRALPGFETVKLVACTAHRDFAASPDRERFDAVLVKPFVRATLLETLKALRGASVPADTSPPSITDPSAPTH
jgi:CheY-like chemotaxis protein